MSFCPCRSTDRSGERARPLGDIVGGILKDLGGKGRVTEEDMYEAWRQAAGDAAAKHSRPVSFKKATIFVNVDRSSWLYELTVKKKEILQKLSAALRSKKVGDIRFRIGDIAAKKE